MTDPIADMLSRLRNAALAGKKTVSLPHSNAKAAVAGLLKESGFVASVKESGAKIDKSLEIDLCSEKENVKFSEIARMSRPGRRWYVNAREIPVVMRGRGIVIISTSQGMMTGEQAKKLKLGGELICRVY